MLIIEQCFWMWFCLFPIFFETLHPRKEKNSCVRWCHISPLPPHNGHLSTKATFLCPQGGRCGQVQLCVYKSYFAKTFSEAPDTGLPDTLVVVRWPQLSCFCRRYELAPNFVCKIKWTYKLRTRLTPKAKPYPCSFKECGKGRGIEMEIPINTAYIGNSRKVWIKNCE